jgi:hypothetical protein
MGFATKARIIISITASILVGLPVFADPIISVGNGVFRPIALEKIIRGALADALNGSVTKSALSFKFAAIKQTVNLPSPTGDLKQILDLLQIKETLALGVSPIHADFTLPDSALKITIQNYATNSFLVNAKWSLSQLNAGADALTIDVPEGFFDQAFQIKSSPVKIALKGKIPLQFAVSLLVNLSDQGAKIKLQSVSTNLASVSHPDFAVTIGQLTVNNQPLTLSLQSDGKTLTADEPTLRAQFQKLEAAYADAIRIKLAAMIPVQIKTQMLALERQTALKYDLKTDDLLKGTAIDSNLVSLVKGMDISFMLSYLQSLSSLKAYSAQIAAKICLDGQCLSPLSAQTNIGLNDIRTMTESEDASMILNESFFKSFLESATFQKRIQTYYNAAAASPGVTLAPAGLKVFFDPSLNSVVAILNLQIDIKKTITPTAKFSERTKKEVGDWIENEFGSGKFVQIPVPIQFKLSGIEKDSSGEANIVIDTSLSSLSAIDGGFTPYSGCSASECPNNVSAMKDIVRKTFIPMVRSQLEAALKSSVPSYPTLRIPVGTVVNLENEFVPQSISITPNRGLMLSFSLKTIGGARP